MILHLENGNSNGLPLQTLSSIISVLALLTGHSLSLLWTGNLFS